MASQTGTDKWRALECNPEVLEGFLNKVSGRRHASHSNSVAFDPCIRESTPAFEM